jgi:hypothetical protein
VQKCKNHKENHRALLEASKEFGLEVNKEKTKYMVFSHHQYAGQNRDHNHNLLIAKNSLKMWQSLDFGNSNGSKLHSQRN